MSFRCIALLILSTQLFSCAQIAVKESDLFKLEGRDYLYQKTEWSFSGRLAISDQNQSLSASINWDHKDNKDVIELSGAFGQGRTLIELSQDKMIVDDGEQRLHYFGEVDALISQLLGVAVPFSALKFWVRGLVFPKKDYQLIEKGFLQSESTIKYLQMQAIGLDQLPRKIKIVNNQSTLKLVINRWQLP